MPSTKLEGSVKQNNFKRYIEVEVWTWPIIGAARPSSPSSMLARTVRAVRLSNVARTAVPAIQRRGFISSSDDYGSHLFKGAVADEYLSKQGLPAGLLDDPSWTKTSADKVAAAVMEWANDKGASVFTHWFQPLGASGVRHGLTGQVHNAMFVFGADGKPSWSLSGKELLKGETDGSSYPSGGMRATHTAGGYTILDPTSPIFLRGDTVFIPTVFVSFYGDALDEKTPLLRSMQATPNEHVAMLDVAPLGPRQNAADPIVLRPLLSQTKRETLAGGLDPGVPPAQAARLRSQLRVPQYWSRAGVRISRSPAAHRDAVWCTGFIW